MYIETESLELTKLRVLDKFMEGHKGFIAGGCFKNIFYNKKMKDVDIFFQNEKDFIQAKRYFSNAYKSEFDEMEGNPMYYVYYENDNCLAFKHKDTDIAVELIKKTYGTVEEILNMFDFTVTKFAYFKRDDGDGYTYCGYYHQKYFEHLTNRKLVIESPNSLFPVSTFERSFRYGRYGFGLCKESKANLIEALQGAKTEDLSNALYFGID